MLDERSSTLFFIMNSSFQHFSCYRSPVFRAIAKEQQGWQLLWCCRVSSSQVRNEDLIYTSFCDNQSLHKEIVQLIVPLLQLLCKSENITIRSDIITILSALAGNSSLLAVFLSLLCEFQFLSNKIVVSSLLTHITHILSHDVSSSLKESYFKLISSYL